MPLSDEKSIIDHISKPLSDENPLFGHISRSLSDENPSLKIKPKISLRAEKFSLSEN